MTSKKIYIIGLGNILLKDEGFGVHLIKYLQKEKLGKNIELVDGGTAGFNLLDFMSPVRNVNEESHNRDVLTRKPNKSKISNGVNDSPAIIFIDVINTNARPGRIYRFDNGSFQILNMHDSMSLHQVGLVDILHLSKTVNKQIKYVILAVVPKEIGWGMELTPLLAQKIPKMAKLVKKEIDNL